MPIQNFDLRRQNKSLKKQFSSTLEDVLSDGIFTLGENVKKFENEFARYCGVKYAVGVASGTDAIMLSMKALRLGAEDEVIVPANAYPTAFGVSLSGARVRLIDIDENGNIDIDLLDKSITKKTKAILVVHFYGNPVDVFLIKKVLRKYRRRIFIVEDAAHAHGAKIGNHRVGSVGDIGCFSFYPTKNLGAFGDGGIVTTNDKYMRDQFFKLRVYGEKKRYESIRVSGTSRLDEIQAAILRIKLKHLDKWNKMKLLIFRFYAKKLLGIGDISIISHKANVVPCWHLFVIKTKYRDELKKYLSKSGIVTAIHYPKPIHFQQSFTHLGYKKGDFPIAEKQSKEILSLPFFPELTYREILTVTNSIKRFYSILEGS